MNINQDFVCNICKKIFKNAVKLPCNCQSVCNEHTEKTLNKKGNILCSKCKKLHEITNEDFEQDKLKNDQIENDFHLTKEYKDAKNSIENILETIQNQIDDFKLKINEFSLKQADHFENIRREIDIKRENIIDKTHSLSEKESPSEDSEEQIRKICKESEYLIKQVEQAEEEFRITFNKKIVPNLINIDVVCEKNQINEVFRDPDLIFDDIEKLQNQYKVSEKLMQKKSKFFKLFELDLTSNKFFSRINSLGVVELNVDFKKTFYYLNLSGQKKLF